MWDGLVLMMSRYTTEMGIAVTASTVVCDGEMPNCELPN